MNKLTAMGTFLIHWKNCTSCFPTKKFTMTSKLCPTGKMLYAATHARKGAASANVPKP